MENAGKEICAECGVSVALGSGNYVNRTPIADDRAEREELGMPYPDGEFVCQSCNEKLDAEMRSFLPR